MNSRCNRWQRDVLGMAQDAQEEQNYWIADCQSPRGCDDRIRSHLDYAKGGTGCCCMARGNHYFHPISSLSPRPCLPKTRTVEVPLACRRNDDLSDYQNSNKHYPLRYSSEPLGYTSKGPSAFDLYKDWRHDFVTDNTPDAQITIQNQDQRSPGRDDREEEAKRARRAPALLLYQDDCRGEPSQLEQQSHKVIEIAPGIMARLRGSQETWEAIQNDFITSAYCVCCSEIIHCIRDADFLLCPTCRVVNPLTKSIGKSKSDNASMISVGLGMRDVDLCKWRVEMWEMDTPLT